MANDNARSTAEVAEQLVSLCREGRNGDAVNLLYAPNVVSVESGGPPGSPLEQTGIDAVRGKGAWWVENNVVHAQKVIGPFIGDGDQFAVYFDYETTFKPTNQRMTLREMALYTVQRGQIVHEHFFYNGTPAT